MMMVVVVGLVLEVVVAVVVISGSSGLWQWWWWQWQWRRRYAKDYVTPLRVNTPVLKYYFLQAIPTVTWDMLHRGLQ
jgi:hypothetical protein